MISANSPFDERATEYDAYRTGYSRTLYDALSEIGFAPGWHVLDVACGTGLASEPLLQRGMTVTGVDVSEPMLEKARARIPQGEFVRGEAESLPFDRGEFHAVVCAQAVHWMDQEKAVAEMARVVRPGGRVAVWWKTLTPDEPLRALRVASAGAVGKEPPPDIMQGSFRAFYKQPFAERWLR
ncbi:MAG: class I SAM-dependent methyltransferase, partial [Vulcanimicrobiaceae bacterium]